MVVNPVNPTYLLTRSSPYSKRQLAQAREQAKEDQLVAMTKRSWEESFNENAAYEMVPASAKYGEGIPPPAKYGYGELSENEAIIEDLESDDG